MAKHKSRQFKTSRRNKRRHKLSQTLNNLVKEFPSTLSNKFRVSKAVKINRVTVSRTLHLVIQSTKTKQKVQLLIKFRQVGLSIKTHKSLPLQLVLELAWWIISPRMLSVTARWVLVDLVSRLGEVLVNNKLSRAKMRFFSKLNQFHNHNSKFSVQDFMQISTLTIRFQINKALSSVKPRHSNPSKQRNKLYRKKSPSTDRMSVI